MAVPPEAPRLSIVSALGRGLASLRANWKVVLVHLAQSLIVGLLVVGGLLPPMLVAGAGGLSDVPWGEPQAAAAQVEEWARALVRRFDLGDPAMLTALAATAVVWLLALIVAGFFLGGIYGVLAAADRQAPAGPGRPWPWYRTYSLENVLGWGRLYVWRYLGFTLLGMLVGMALLGAGVLLVGLATLAAARWGTGPGIAMGCGLSLPLAFLLVAVILWFQLGLAALALDGSGVGRASRVAVQVLGRRLGGLLGLALLLTPVAVGVALVFLLLSVAADAVLAGLPGPRLAASVVLSLSQTVASGLLTVLIAATTVALVRSEARRPSNEGLAA